MSLVDAYTIRLFSKILFFNKVFFCCCQICFKCNTFLFFIIFFKHFSFLLFFTSLPQLISLYVSFIMSVGAEEERTSAVEKSSMERERKYVLSGEHLQVARIQNLAWSKSMRFRAFVGNEAAKKNRGV